MNSADTNHAFTSFELAALDRLWGTDLTLEKITNKMRALTGVRVSEAEVRRAALRHAAPPVVIVASLVDEVPDYRPRAVVWKPRVRASGEKVRLVPRGTWKVPVGGYKIGISK